MGKSPEHWQEQVRPGVQLGTALKVIGDAYVEKKIKPEELKRLCAAMMESIDAKGKTPTALVATLTKELDRISTDRSSSSNDEVSPTTLFAAAMLARRRRE